MKSPSPATMKALVKEGPSVDALRIARWQMPVARAGEVVVRVGAVGICGTDLSLYHWYPEIVNVYDAKLPLVLGHEFSGHVAALGDGVLSCAIGTLVAVNPIITCGTCFHCGRGESNLCDRRVFIGGQRHGALAEYVAVPAEQVVPLPATIGTEVAALAEPFCVALHALERVPISARDVVAIVGAGSIGLLLAIAASAAGARCIVTGLGRDRARLEIARRLGAEAIDIERDDPRAVVRALTEGRGADVVFETSGDPRGVVQAIDCVRKAGHVGLIGMPHDPTPISTTIVVTQEKTIVGCRAYTPQTWRRCLEILPANAEKLRALISDRVPLEHAADAFRLMCSPDAIKILVVLDPAIGNTPGASPAAVLP